MIFFLPLFNRNVHFASCANRTQPFCCKYKCYGRRDPAGPSSSKKYTRGTTHAPVFNQKEVKVKRTQLSPSCRP